jgi:conjugative transfer ATPase
MFNKKPYVSRQDIARAYKSLPSLAERLPWRDFNEKHKCILLEDNESLGVCFKITPIPCEARPESMLNEIAKSLSEAIKNSIPCEKESPWVLQVYVHKESDLSDVYTEIENYFPEHRKSSPLTQAYLKNLKEHFEYVTQPGGIFHDTQVTNLNFQGGLLHVYAVLYRRKGIKENRYSRLEEITRIARKFSDQLRACGVRVKRMRGNEFYKWMAQWFNPTSKLLDSMPFPDEISKPIGFDLVEQLFFSAPESFEEGWLFDGMPHKVITVQNMTINPDIGHLTAERKRNTDDKVFNLVDHLPGGSVLVMTVVMQAPSEAELHFKSIQNSAVGNHAQAVKVKEEISIAEKSIADGNHLFPVVINLYLRGESLEDLHANESHAEVLLNSNGFKVITEDELFPIDAYLRYLPMCYDVHFDRRNSQRSRYMQLSDIAKLLPFYGRSRGTEHPGMVMFNRGGEPWFYDLMVDKTKNAHFLLLGETGTGKSNLLNFLIMQDLALYNSRFFIIDAGGSFDLLGDYCKSFGLTVNKIKIDPKHPVSLNPFAYGLRVIDQIESLNTETHEEFLSIECDKLLKEQSDNVKNQELDEEPRDILGDMVLAALIMITGGEKKEEDTIRRSDRMLIIDAIINAAYFVRDNNREQMIASDIIDAFERITLKLNPDRDAEKIRRAREMADSMRYFTNDPVSAKFFNSYGTPWELADVTIVDFGLFANEGYEAQRSIAFAGCMTKILALAEINQKSNRSIKVVLDENHIFTSIPLLADIETRVAKMGRKLGLWLWLATQNLRDFADNARRMLAQIEHWICLSLPLDEIDQIERFKQITIEMRNLFLSARKEKGKYTEGVILGMIKALFRNVPPSLYLAMAATDQDEKNHRAQIMQKFQCSEIEAVKIIARDMMKLKQETKEDD